MVYLRMRGITKLYPENNVLANAEVDLEVRRNEIHALVGENGAGKSTLMKILYGLERADRGSIELQDRPVHIASPLDASRLGIGMVHQHFRLIPDFTIAENVVLGHRAGPPRPVPGPRRAPRASVRAVIEEYGFSIDPSLRVRELTVGQMQVVEIIKILYRRAELLILDEPTSVLTEQQIQTLFRTLRNLRDIGKTVIIITHKLGEVKEISERVTVMRAGRVVAVRQTAEVDERELSRLMVGKNASLLVRREPSSPGRPVLELEQASLLARGQDRPLLDRVDLSVHAGELVGVAGVSGNGLGELEDVVSGLRRISSGRILHDGQEITRLDARAIAPARPRLRAGRPPAPRLQPELIGHGEHDHRQPPPLPAGRGAAPPEGGGLRHTNSAAASPSRGTRGCPSAPFRGATSRR